MVFNTVSDVYRSYINFKTITVAVTQDVKTSMAHAAVDLAGTLLGSSGWNAMAVIGRLFEYRKQDVGSDILCTYAICYPWPPIHSGVGTAYVWFLIDGRYGRSR